MFRFWKRSTSRTRELALREGRVTSLDSDRWPQTLLREHDWEERLWVACKTLTLAPDHVMTAISTSGTLSGDAWEVASLMLLAERLADEFGLRVSADIDGDSFTMRFSRCPQM